MKRLLLATALLAAACRPAAEPSPPVPAGLESADAPVRAQYEERRRALDAAGAGVERGTRWGELGLWFEAYEQWEAAATCHRAARARDPDPRWLEHLAHAERLGGDGNAARASFTELLRLRPEAAPPRVWLGELELDAGRPEAARAQFEAALRLAPETTRARAGLGRVALEEGRPALAVELLERALSEQPDSGVLHHLLGRALRAAGDEPRATVHLRRAAEQGAALRPVAMDDPVRAEAQALRTSARAEGSRAAGALREGRFEDALARLHAARAADPLDEAATLNLARAQARLGDPAAAIETLADLLQRQPRHARALEVRGLARSLAGDAAGALADLRASAEADPGNVGAHRQVARLLWSGGERAASLPYWSRVAELEPGDAQARLRRAEALAETGRWAEAIAALRRDLREVEPAPPFRLALARALSTAPEPHRDGRAALALALAEHARAPRLRQAETVALAHAAAGDRAAALAWQRAALAAVTAAGRAEKDGWVARRLALLEAGVPEERLFLDDEGRGSLRVPAP